ncbi:hypothetical protein [Gloeocapsopsis sp. IPPAS B-1203]|uniref:hypothetical protein n=1 Tax=Gloeocapsopsis sp. IPPAS B-1203 TaxID=2049454 RepID=UPI000C18012B|nr:hypothetical protein [Gloeocapsopsis sp. IPPAS B-1203]PIG95293.1 hypothetical protein CSQ79_02235 [Gloeocapsopsis sp. IPPAS B-1203]
MYPSHSEDKARTNGYGRHNPDATSRPTFYMSEELLRAIQIQAQRERNSRSGFISGLLSFLLLSPVGQQLRDNARSNNRTLAQELEQSLALLQQQIPIEQVNQLAVTSQRSQIEMLTHLVLLGLQAYSRE